MKGARIPYSADELAWIKAFADMPRREMHELFVQVWGRQDVSLANLNALCKRNGWFTGRSGQFVKGVKRADNPAQKGYAPLGCEKGWFRPGHRGGQAKDNHKPIGTERITRDGYRERKVNDDLPLNRRWRAVHLIEWETLNGPLPAGHALKCLDANKLNTEPSNWALVPRALLPRLNGRFGRDYDQAPAELKPTLLAIAKLEHKAREIRRAKG